MMQNMTTLTMLLQTQNISITRSELFGCFDPGKNKQHKQYDFLDDIGISPRTNDEDELVIKRMSDDDYYTLVCSLNEKQQQFFIMSYIQSKLKMTLSGCS